MNPLRLPSTRQSVILSMLLGTAVTFGCDSNSQKYPGRDGGTAEVKKGDGGSIQITGNANQCPTVALTLSPPDAKVGQTVIVGAAASDPDLGTTLTYAWTAPAGSFANRTVAQTTYTCETGGPQVLMVAVSDGKCTTSESITVTCFGLPGSGGAGGAQTGSGGRAGTGGAGGAATGTGGRVGSGTGGSTVGGTGGRTGTGGANGSGGATTASCSADPTMDEGAACDECTVENCVPKTDGCSLDLLGSDAKRQKCLDLYCCLRANKCRDGDPQNCWCGTADVMSCTTLAGAANGPCLRQFEAAAEDTNPMKIKLRLVDPNYAIGGATNLAGCRRNFCSVHSGEPNNSCSL